MSKGRLKQGSVKKTLTKSLVFARIRPFSTSGDCAHTASGEAGSKQLDGWNETSVTVDDKGRRQRNVFDLTGVVPPEASQEDAYQKMMPELVNGFHSDSNVMFFAYGQTGSGKTHTMLGEIDSLASPKPVAGWGLFPRLVHSTIEVQREWRAQGTQSILIASAVEFYCMGATDLNAKAGVSTPVTIDRDAQVYGVSSFELTSTEQLKEWILRMYSNRTTAKTKMNDGSSRSHCAFILQLHQLRSDGNYIRTNFSIIDMAGSERHSKTGGQRMTGMEAGLEAYRMYNAGTPELLSVGAQGTMINMELSFIATEILKAADMHKKGIPFTAAKEMSTAASFYFSACFDGRARLGACITVSPSPQHGFETWFALEYAQKLAQCRTPLRKVRPAPIAKVLVAAKRAAKEAEASFQQTNQNPSFASAKAARVFMLRQGALVHTAQTLVYLERLVAQAKNESDLVH